ncbi:ABC transporter permease [Kribbella sp. NPDC051620]|uniref:ABC transporter permease n=1 Tax=Kribbella sp. NPDC051620 TaxID=3364120 RepID=UPI00378D1AB7
MSLITVERIKLFTTRSPWWCMVLSLLLFDGVITLPYIFAPDDTKWTTPDTQSFYLFGLVVMMVMAALAVTTEYRFSTIRTSFLSVPKRTPILVAKAVVVSGLSAVVGLASAFLSLLLAKLLVADAGGLTLKTAADWRAVAGMGAVYFLAALIAVAIGILVRQSAGAIAIAVCWPLLLEGIGLTIPKVGDFVSDWGPFSRAGWFITGTSSGPDAADALMSPGWSLVYFAGWAIGLLVVALVVAKKRDA